MTDELAERVKVWIALSDLFLDTDVTLSYENIVRTCAESPYSNQELSQILVNEVSPVCAPNLLSIAGEWTSFDEQWLVNRIMQHRRSSQGLLAQMVEAIMRPIRALSFNAHTQKHWALLEPRIEQYRATIIQDNTRSK
jgi:hypothetical protein